IARMFHRRVSHCDSGRILENIFANLVRLVFGDDHDMARYVATHVEPPIVGLGDPQSEIVVGFGILTVEHRPAAGSKQFPHPVTFEWPVFLLGSWSRLRMQPSVCPRLLS